LSRWQDTQLKDDYDRGKYGFTYVEEQQCIAGAQPALRSWTGMRRSMWSFGTQWRHWRSTSWREARRQDEIDRARVRGDAPPPHLQRREAGWHTSINANVSSMLAGAHGWPCQEQCHLSLL